MALPTQAFYSTKIVSLFLMTKLNEHIPLYSVLLKCTVTSRIHFPNFPGIPIRGGFGFALKDAVCVSKDMKYCSPCLLASTCPYACVFETPNVQSLQRMKHATHIPHPFAITPLFDYPALFLPESSFTIKLSIFGSAFRFFPHILYAFIKLGERGVGNHRGKFVISEIKNYADGTVVYSDSGLLLSDIEPILIANAPDKRTCEISFITPCKIKSKGTYLQHADLKEIVKNIKRKLENISYFFGTSPVSLDISGIHFDAIHCEVDNFNWKINTRYSRRRKETMRLGGFTGRMQLSGDVANVYPVLKIGEAIGVGSNTSFGFGAIQVA